MDSSNFSDSDSDGGVGEELGEHSASRKKRGLKILSVKVQELVYRKQRTTYKDVANELIEQLRKNNDPSIAQEFASLKGDFSDDDEDELGGEDSSYEG